MMILTNDKIANEQNAAAAATKREADEGPSKADQHPPPYTYSPSGPSVNPVPSTSPNNMPPTNHLYVFRPHASIKGEYLVDIDAAAPPATALVKSDQCTNSGGGVEHRDNLRLESKHANISARVWVADLEPGSADAKRHARIKFLNDHAKVQCVVTGPRRPLLSIVARSIHAPVSLKIPRSFHGQLTLYSVHGKVQPSPELERRMATLSEADGTRVYFVGPRPRQWRTTIQHDGSDTDPKNIAEDGELVDEAYAGSKHAHVRVWYDDEAEPVRGPGVFGSFMKVLGL